MFLSLFQGVRVSLVMYGVCARVKIFSVRYVYIHNVIFWLFIVHCCLGKVIRRLLNKSMHKKIDE